MTIFTRVKSLLFLLVFLFSASILEANIPPTFTSTPTITSIAQGSAYRYTLTGSDLDGDTLTFSVTNGTTLHPWLHFVEKEIYI